MTLSLEDPNKNRNNNAQTGGQSKTSSLPSSDQHDDDCAESPLQRARLLRPPPPQSTANAEYEGSEFWEDHHDLLRNAWREWDETIMTMKDSHKLHLWDDHLLDPTLQAALEQTREDPVQGEAAVRKLFTQVAPEVYKFQLLNPEGIPRIREILHQVQTDSRIPYRRPNGMNRYGMIFDPETPGAVSSRMLTDCLHQQLVDDILRPCSRLLFPGFFPSAIHARNEPPTDSQSYAFTIQYRPGKDIALAEHSDASLMTLNVNLDVHSYDEPNIYFCDNNDSNMHHNLTFAPGMAVIHRGLVRHAAYPIGPDDERTNLVLWTFGEYGVVRIVEFPPHERMTLHERWSKKRSEHENGWQWKFSEL